MVLNTASPAAAKLPQILKTAVKDPAGTPNFTTKHQSELPWIHKPDEATHTHSHTLKPHE